MYVFPSLGVPRFAERNDQERSTKYFFKKIKNIFADGLPPHRSATGF
jgi:hypothetical protein